MRFTNVREYKVDFTVNVTDMELSTYRTVDLEEMGKNLILNSADLPYIVKDLLNSYIDIDDYFDSKYEINFFS